MAPISCSFGLNTTLSPAAALTCSFAVVAKDWKRYKTKTHKVS
jgi:hypothetical protein